MSTIQQTWARLTDELKQDASVNREILNALKRLNIQALLPHEGHLTTADKTVAWEIGVELRTRISTQELHFLDGNESSALASLHALFEPARELLRDHGPACCHTARLVELMLNEVLRPMTSTWHRRQQAGDFGRDDATREFRLQLACTQQVLRFIEQLLYAIATSPDAATQADAQHVDATHAAAQPTDTGQTDAGQVRPTVAGSIAPVESSLENAKADEAAAGERGGKDTEATTAEAPLVYDRLLGFPRRGPLAGQAFQIVLNERRELIERRAVVKDFESRQMRKNDQGELVRANVDHLREGCDDLVGLAVSGGGIRSATFALGVVQGLVANGIFKQVDLLSTVSGGGYLGAFLSSMLNTDVRVKPDTTQKRDDNDATEQPPDQAPAPAASTIEDPFQTSGEHESRAIRFLRNHSRYILPANFAGWAMTIGQAAYGVVSNLLILSTVVFFAVVLTHVALKPDLTKWYDIVRNGGVMPPGMAQLNPVSWFALAVSAVALLLLPWVQKVGRIDEKKNSKSSRYERAVLRIVGASLVVITVGYLPLAHFGYLSLMHWIGTEWLSPDDGSGGWSLRATLVSLSSLIGLVAARAESLRMTTVRFPQLRRLVFVVLWMAGPLLFAYTYFELSRVYVAAQGDGITSFGWLQVDWSQLKVLLGLFAFSVAYAAGVNVNFTSLHRYYRDRLADTYLLKFRDGEVVSTEKHPVQKQLLSDMRTDGSPAPYHLVNAALNLQSSARDELRGRECDFFVFSKHFCGSQILEYAPTQDWERGDPHLDLGTAVAISGAAAAPQMGMVSVRSASFLMTLINIRMGYWLHKPVSAESRLRIPSAMCAPGPDYLVREAMNRIDETTRYVNLSDGGHIENLAIYELLRRRCRFIITIDGECDPDIDCISLMRLEQFAKVDLGVDIKMQVEHLKWVEVIPTGDTNSEQDKDTEAIVRPVRQRTRYSRGHFAVGKIKYTEVNGEKVTGWMVYIKLSVTGNELDYIKDYRRRYPDFPHQSTGDQVFEEDQFEAYRRLGEHISEDLFLEELIGASNRQAAERQGLGVDQWVTALRQKFCRDVEPSFGSSE